MNGDAWQDFNHSVNVGWHEQHKDKNRVNKGLNVWQMAVLGIQQQ